MSAIARFLRGPRTLFVSFALENGVYRIWTRVVSRLDQGAWTPTAYSYTSEAAARYFIQMKARRAL